MNRNTKESNHIPGTQIGPVKDRDIELLHDRQTKQLKRSKLTLLILPLIIFAVTPIVFWDSIGLQGLFASGVIAYVITFISMKVLLKKEKDRLEQIKDNKLISYKYSGTLSMDGGGENIYIIKLDKYLLPEIIEGSAIYKELKPYTGKIMTAEYVPQISKNIRLYDSSGHGFDFLANSQM